MAKTASCGFLMSYKQIEFLAASVCRIRNH